MECSYYERKLNDVIMKCPIEAGVEILVYNVIDSTIDSSKFALVDINRLWKDRDSRLQTDSGIADIAILSTDFKYRTDIGKVYGFIEVKATSNELAITEQIEGQKRGAVHYIYTNGLVWMYFKEGKKEWEKVLASCDNQECRVMNKFKKVSIDSEEFSDLIKRLREISWRSCKSINM